MNTTTPTPAATCKASWDVTLAEEHYGVVLSSAVFASCLARVVTGESARTVVGALTMDEVGVSL